MKNVPYCNQELVQDTVIKYALQTKCTSKSEESLLTCICSRFDCKSH